MKEFLKKVFHPFKPFVNAVVSAWHSVKSFAIAFWKAKRNRLYLGGFPGSVLAFAMFVSMTCSFLPNNLVQTVAEQTQSYIAKEGHAPSGVVMGVDMLGISTEVIAVPTEQRKKLSNINSLGHYWNVYPALLNPYYSPLLADYGQEEKVPLTMVLANKDGYANPSFDPSYEIPLLCGGTGYSANIDDLYLNQSYADALLKQLGKKEYKDLLNLSIEIPYKTQLGQYELVYRIKGVIDESSERYQELKYFFGDFCLGNEYLNIPVPWVTFFRFGTDAYDNYAKIRNINNVFQYDTILKRYSSTSNEFAFDYRIFLLDGYGTAYGLKSLWDNDYNVRIGNAYNVFFTRQFIVNLIFLGLFSIAMAIPVAFLHRRLLKGLLESNPNSFATFFFSWALGVLPATALGILFAHLLGRVVPLLSALSMNSFVGYLIIVGTALVLFVIALIRYRKARGKLFQSQLDGSYEI